MGEGKSGKKNEGVRVESVARTEKAAGNGAAQSADAARPKLTGAHTGGGSAKAGSAASEIDAQKTSAAATQKPTVSHMLGELVWLLSQSPAHKHFTIGDLEWMVMPAILLEQFRVFHGPKHLLGFALWAYMAEEAESRFKAQVESGRGARLRPDDWKSGDRLWLIELVAPFATPENKLRDAMLADLVAIVFKQNKFNFISVDPKSGIRIVTVGGEQ